jgi:large subunit ribosomal protein L9
MAARLLLIEDVETLGRSGDIVNVKPGYARNFLLPQRLAVVADKSALRRQEKLKEERQKKADIDRQESDEIAARIGGLTLTSVVKVDHEGHMYGSVTANEIIHLLQEQGQIHLDRKSIVLKQPIKETGVYSILVKLKEGVTANFQLKVISEEGHRAALNETQPTEQA